MMDSKVRARRIARCAGIHTFATATLRVAEFRHCVGSLKLIRFAFRPRQPP